MENQITRFLAASKEHEALKEKMKASKAELIEAMSALGSNAHFQDPIDGTIFKIVIPTGTFISFDRIGYERTKREDEIKGSLSVKKAQELGYTVK